MQPTSLLRKTLKGVEEIETRKLKLPGRLRNILFMIDGERTVGSLLDQAGGLADQLETQLGELLTLGMIEEIVAAAPVDEGVAPGSPSSASPAPGARASASPAPGARASAPPTLPTPSQPPPAQSPAQPVLTIDQMRTKLTAFLSASMGMRAMFLGNQVAALDSRAAFETFIDDTAKSHATTAGPAAANKWRDEARKTLRLA
jgi:hypothetical protein